MKIEHKICTLSKGNVFGMTNKVLRVCAAASMRNPIPLHWDKDISLSKWLLMMWGFRWYLEPAR